eukprot:6304060-Amphidinium_carterae.1
MLLSQATCLGAIVGIGSQVNSSLVPNSLNVHGSVVRLVVKNSRDLEHKPAIAGKVAQKSSRVVQCLIALLKHSRMASQQE